MNWTVKISLVLIFAVMFSAFMHEGLYQPKGAEAAIGTTTAWTSLGSTYHTATKTPTANIAVAGTASTNRVLAVAVTFVGNAAQTATCAVSYGGTPLTLAAGDASGTSSLDHTWIYYLPENNSLMDGTSKALATTVTSTATAIMTDAYYIVLNGVDQATPLGSGTRPNVNRTAISGTAVTMTAGTGLLVNANEQAIAIFGSARSASTTAVTITGFGTGWTNTTSQNSTATNSNRSYVNIRAIPASNLTEDLLTGTASSSNCVTSVTGVSFRPLASNATTAGSATATVAGVRINVSAPYSDDGNGDNTITVQYKLHSDSIWTTWGTPATHPVSPYTTTITGLAQSSLYDVQVIYADADGVTGTATQPFTSLRTGKIDQLTNWTSVYNGTTLAMSGTNFTVPNGTTNRMLVVAISSIGASSNTDTDPSVITYGGVTMTKAVGVLTAARPHTWFYYLPNNAVMDNTARPLNVTLSTTTPANIQVWAAVFDNVDQVAPTGLSNTSNSDSTTASLTGGLTVDADDQALYILSIWDNGATTIPTYSTNANWVSKQLNSGVYNSANGWSVQIANRNIPASQVTGDTAVTGTISPSSRPGMSGIVLSPTTGPKPTISTVVPNVIGQGATRNITITGTNYVAGATVTVSGTLATASNVVVAGDGLSLTADVTATTGAATGARNITITNPDSGAGTGTGVLTVNARPTVTLASPNTTTAGTTDLAVTVTGTGFQSGATAAFNGTAGITVKSTVWNSATSLTVTIDATSVGAGNTITVTNPDGGISVAGGSFTVSGPLPTVTGINPAAIGQGATRAGVAIIGTNFVTGAAVSFSGSGVTASGCNVGSDTQITCSVTATAGAATGARNVTVTNTDTGVGAGVGLLTVNAVPTVSSANPNTTPAGTTNLNVIVTGTGFQSGATAVISGGGITVNSTTYDGPTQLTVNIDAASSGGGRTITVTNPDGGVSAAGGSFAVTGGLPTVGGINPNVIGQGATRTGVVITGTNFVTGAAVSFSGSGVTASGCTIDSGTQITCNVTATAGAATGARNVTVTNTDTGTATGTGLLTVNAAPTVTSATPAASVQGRTIDVTIGGGNFQSGATSAFGSGITVNSSNYNSGSSLTANITIDPAATAGTRTVTITNPDNGTGVGSVFTVNEQMGSTITTCTGCHAYPASGGLADGTARNVPAGQFPGSHSASTHSQQVCTVCHVDNGSNMAHRNGNIDIAAGVAYSRGTSVAQSNAALNGGTCSGGGSSCHTSGGSGGSPSSAWGTPGGDCISCHTLVQTGTHGTPRDAVSTEFGLAWGHKKTGRGAVTVADCIVCHLEGDFSTQKPSSYHKDGKIDLRDPDGAGETPITNISGGTFTFTKFATSYAAGSRTSTGHLSDTDVANVITQKFCLACHDSNGAINTTARTAGGTAMMPFGGIDLGATYTVLNGAAALGGVVDVKTQMATSNSSFHPVMGPKTKDFPTPAKLAVPYNNFTRAGTSGTKTTGIVMNCFDCHNTGQSVTNRTIVSHGNAQTINGTLYAAATGGNSVSTPTFCTQCHLTYIGTGHGAGSAVATINNNMSSTRFQVCANCHFSSGFKPARPLQAADVHGFNGLAATGGAWTYGSGSGMRPVAFMRNVGRWVSTSPRPYTAPGLTGTGAQCGGALNTSTGGVSCNETMSTYTPGGSY
ncbi:MAG: hypothetical protein WA610_05445 [Thermodesulfovibrionales bacterium]